MTEPINLSRSDFRRWLGKLPSDYNVGFNPIATYINHKMSPFDGYRSMAGWVVEEVRAYRASDGQIVYYDWGKQFHAVMKTHGVKLDRYGNSGTGSLSSKQTLEILDVMDKE